jgi:hypothetical protein
MRTRARAAEFHPTNDNLLTPGPNDHAWAADVRVPLVGELPLW